MLLYCFWNQSVFWMLYVHMNAQRVSVSFANAYQQSRNSNLYSLSYVFCSRNCKERNNNSNDVSLPGQPVCTQGGLCWYCCWAAILSFISFFLKPPYVPIFCHRFQWFVEIRIFICLWFVMHSFKKKKKSRGTFQRCQIATVVTINPCACIGVENGVQDTMWVSLKKRLTPNICVVLTVHVHAMQACRRTRMVICNTHEYFIIQNQLLTFIIVFYSSIEKYFLIFYHSVRYIWHFIWDYNTFCQSGNIIITHWYPMQTYSFFIYYFFI